jgi:hypothetical protein
MPDAASVEKPRRKREASWTCRNGLAVRGTPISAPHPDIKKPRLSTTPGLNRRKSRLIAVAMVSVMAGEASAVRARPMIIRDIQVVLAASDLGSLLAFW